MGAVTAALAPSVARGTGPPRPSSAGTPPATAACPRSSPTLGTGRLCRASPATSTSAGSTSPAGTIGGSAASRDQLRLFGQRRPPDLPSTASRVSREDPRISLLNSNRDVNNSNHRDSLRNSNSHSRDQTHLIQVDPKLRVCLIRSRRESTEKRSSRLRLSRISSNLNRIPSSSLNPDRSPDHSLLHLNPDLNRPSSSPSRGPSHDLSRHSSSLRTFSSSLECLRLLTSAAAPTPQQLPSRHQGGTSVVARLRERETSSGSSPRL